MDILVEAGKTSPEPDTLEEEESSETEESQQKKVTSTPSQSPDSKVEVAHTWHQQAGLTEKNDGNEYEGAGVPGDGSNSVDVTLKEQDN